jgi:hypothetical protein
MPEGLPILINRAYEGDQTRQLMLDLDMVPPKSTAPNHGLTTALSTRSVTRSNACSGDSRVSAESPLTLKNSM